MIQIQEKYLPRVKTKALKQETEFGKEVTIKGWVRTLRDQKAFAFMEVNDGSEVANIQVVLHQDLPTYKTIIDEVQTGASVIVTGILTQSPGDKQAVEIHAREVRLIGPTPSDYVLQKKRHSFEFLRTIPHLRPRTNTLGAVTRIRSSLAFGVHKFFQERDFAYIHTPIITTSDCEGAGELFTVTTLDLENPPKNQEKKIDFAEDFFGKRAFLTVSGQLHGEAFAQSLSDIYTFGPTFRAENSNTSRHLAEFWMIEPEMAFADIYDDMNLAEDFLRYLIKHVMTENLSDLEFFDTFIEKGLVQRLEHVLQTDTIRLPYTDAISILEKSGKTFEFPVKWGIDLQSEHERFLTEVHFKSPVLVYNYPKVIKPFYMRLNDDGKTAAAMDLLVPVTGELIGGGQREDRYDILEKNIMAQGTNLKDYEWYLDLRKYGSTPHAGFGLGFERLIQYITGMENIRDVTPFPRYPKHADA